MSKTTKKKESSTLDKLVQVVGKLNDSISEVRDQISTITERVDALEKTPAPEPEPETAPSTEESEGGILELVRANLGSAFTFKKYRLSPRQFRLDIFPPAELAEFKGAHHTKVFAYDAEDKEISLWLNEVRTFLVKHANKKGVNFDEHRN